MLGEVVVVAITLALMVTEDPTRSRISLFASRNRLLHYLKNPMISMMASPLPAEFGTLTPDDEEVVRLAKPPMVAARMGRSRKRPLRNDWESVQDQIMREAVLAKFPEHADLRDGLLATGDATIVEHTENDRYWGDSGDGSGRNNLGEILMRVREELRHGHEGDDPAQAGLRGAVGG